MSQTTCKVYGCRYKDTHITRIHQCGLCKMLGHGQKECGKLNLINSLKFFFNEYISFENQCAIQNCDAPNTHTTHGHCCIYCGLRNNQHLKRCPKLTGEYITDPTSVGIDPRAIGKSQELKLNTYTCFYAGMGCQWYVRNNLGSLEYFFLHSDEMGQYGPDTSSIPGLVAFTYGYTEVKFKTN
jgi:hypothetical protein